MLTAIEFNRPLAMQRVLVITATVLMMSGLAACGSPPTKSVRTTTTTVDESGNATAQAHSELRTHVPVESSRVESTTTSRAVPYDTRQTVEQSQSTDVNGTTTTRKQVTNY
jgi:hypothetical protein